MANERARRLRRRMTKQEVKLWLHLRALRKRGFHFRRQAPIDGFIVDFACYHPKLVIEIDGGQHSRDAHLQRDASRDEHLITGGFAVLRFWNNDVDGNLEGVMTLIIHALERDPPTPATPSSFAVPPREGEGWSSLLASPKSRTD